MEKRWSVSRQRSLEEVRVVAVDEQELAADNSDQASPERRVFSRSGSSTRVDSGHHVSLAELLDSHQFRVLKKFHPDHDWAHHYVPAGDTVWQLAELDLEVSVACGGDGRDV